jgi:site-specific recombinase XerD
MSSRRKRMAKGVYRDRYGLSATVKVGTGSNARQREKQFPFDTPLRDIKAWQGDTRSDLGRALGRSPESPRGTLADDATAYLTQVKTLASYKSRVCEVNAWTALYGRLRRSQITSEHVRKARGTWLEQKYTTKTVNNRVQTLRHMYRVLDGSKAPTPADDVAPLPVAPSVKILVPAKTFRTVAANLTDAKTRARFMVIASTGVRPAELKRAERADVDLERKAWGHFDGSDYAKALYAAGWPEDVRRYQARHSMALELAERGIDLADVSAVLGHRQIATTRKHYAPVLVSRLKDASERLAGRFKGWQPDLDEPVDGAGHGSKQPRLRRRFNRHGRDSALKSQPRGDTAPV